MHFHHFPVWSIWLRGKFEAPPPTPLTFKKKFFTYETICLLPFFPTLKKISCGKIWCFQLNKTFSFHHFQLKYFWFLFEALHLFLSLTGSKKCSPSPPTSVRKFKISPPKLPHFSLFLTFFPPNDRFVQVTKFFGHQVAELPSVSWLWSLHQW